MDWFRIATEGATTDGRTISRHWLEQMAANFDPQKYGCRVNLEHIRGVLPDSPFKSYGDVTALKTEEDDAGKLQLLAQIDPTEELKALNQARQKVYTSMEVDPDFAGSGEAYLVGLAVTDSPASLGTEMLAFSAQAGDKSPLTAKKQKPENLFTAAVETDFGFEHIPPKGPTLAERVKTMFKRQREETHGNFAALRDDLEQTMGLFVAENTRLSAELETRPSAEQFQALKAEHDQLKTAFDQLYATLDSTPRHPPRTPATGGDGTLETDC
ncbi:GPO family capsid scaffolding protein [Larsenimonas suaedae]|uniref:GPO family capsid scaffolding protein n=1 Tax=Larsenimonas suaedae TaxID=1851019 RepID=A0ABU1GYJ9_9GAMM|nr:GPO family capsid scaffolding protein [Larsenimonas suaedae]MCM2973511.1 GPO family capsid scaffolding protein [Larsenimonas suaedae]MDR5897119.1 GPO family capsid scaffolding protein [Larsenimonas suaedae]